MPDHLNRIRNPGFNEGTKRPRCWTWTANSEAVDWVRRTDADESDSCLLITSRNEGASGSWMQRIRCQAEHWYRIEAVVTCRCEGSHEHAGAGLWVAPLTDADTTGGRVRLAGALRSSGLLTLRAYYKTPVRAKRLEVYVGLWRAAGSVTIHSVLVIPNVESDARSHPLALPPPPYAYAAPRKVRRLCVCDDTGEDRPLVAILRKRYGQGSVSHSRSSALRASALDADALIIAGQDPPAWMRTLSALEKIASKHLVVVSLEAFSRIAGHGLTIRTIEQADDPLHAKIKWGNFISRGFALQDVFPFASTTSDSRVFRQRHLRRGAALTRLRKTHGFEAMIVSMTDADATSDHPLCLYKPVESGGIIVFDTDSIETPATTCDEPNLAAYLLFNMLGADQSCLGQYTVPAETERDWYLSLQELPVRYPAFRLSGQDRHHHVVELGAEQKMLGLPSRCRPLLLIRTGLGGDDPAGVYGVLLYLKQLVRPEPYRNAYVRDLINEFRLAWVPLCAPWQGNFWDEGLASQRAAVNGDFEPGSVAAVIEITESPSHELRIVYRQDDPDFGRQATSLAALAADFSAGRYFYRAVPKGARINRRDDMSWNTENLIPLVVVEPAGFDTDFHRSAASAGARLIRIEIPGSNANFVCNSIWRTDMVATTLEHVIGLQYGLIAMNRYSSSIASAGHPPLQPGEAINIRADAIRGMTSIRAG